MGGSPMDIGYLLGWLPGALFVFLVIVSFGTVGIDWLRHPERYAKKDNHGSGDDNWYE